MSTCTLLGAMILLFATLGACAPTPGTGAPGFALSRVKAGAREMACVVYTPEQAAHALPPVILFLHGRGECGEDGWRHVRNSSIAQAVMADPARWPFVIVMPQKPEASAQWEEYDAVVMAALEQAISRTTADPTRVYLTGLSQGGHGTWAFAAAHPDRFAAIVPICGYLNADFRETPPDASLAAALAAKLDAIPVWSFHGDSDDVVPPSHTRVMLETLRRRGSRTAETKGTVYPGVGHNAWDSAYAEPELPRWLLGHVAAPAR